MSLTIVIAVGLAVGHLLHLGDHQLEVPISAMLILSLDTRAAASGRIVDTVVGAGAGLLGGLILAPVQVQRAEEAIDDLCRRLAGLLDLMPGDLEAGSAVETAGERLSQARALGGEIQRVDRALVEAEDSLRLNLRGRSLRPYARSALRAALEALEHTTTTVRGMARAVADVSQVDGESLQDPRTRQCLAAPLRQLAAAVRAFGVLTRAEALPGAPADAYHQRLEADLAQRLAAARQEQDKLAEILRAEPATGQVAWPLRGELLAHISRIQYELQPDHHFRAWERWPRHDTRWPQRVRAARLYARLQPRKRHGPPPADSVGG